MKKLVLFIACICLSTSMLYSEYVDYFSLGKNEYIFVNSSIDSYFRNARLGESIYELKRGNYITYTPEFDKYKRFYIESILQWEDPYIYYSIIIQPGYRIVLRTYGYFEDHVYQGIKDFNDYLEFRERIDLKQPLYQDSNIVATDGDMYDDYLIYEFSNGSSLSLKKWDELYEAMQFFNVPIEQKDIIATLIADNDLSLITDDFDKNVIVHLQDTLISSADDITEIYYYSPPVQLCVMISRNSVQPILIVTQRAAESENFNSFTLGADLERWESGDINFKNTLVVGNNFKTTGISADDELVSFMKNFVKAKKSRVRFRDGQRYVDEIIPESTLKAQAAILEIYRILNN